MGKATFRPPPAGAYRDDPNHAETASMESAVLLDTIDYPDEELSSHQDTPSQSRASLIPGLTRGSITLQMSWARHNPLLIFFSSNWSLYKQSAARPPLLKLRHRPHRNPLALHTA
jgi:hypothetical protein